MTVSETQYQDWSDDLAELDQQIEDLQKAKGDFYKTVRDEHGKKTADALKLAVKISRMDTEKRSAAEEVDAEAFRILSIISKPRAPRATRAREIIEEFPVEHDEDGVFPDDEPQVVPQPAQSEPLVTIHSDPLRSGAAIHEDAEQEAPTTPIQPETANSGEAQETAAAVGASPTIRAAEDIGAQPYGGDHEEVIDALIIETETADAMSSGLENDSTVTGDGSSALPPISDVEPVAPLYAAPGVITIQQNGPEPMVAHPYATCWPVNSIDVTDGVREPIVKIGPLILDGRGRYLAARRTHTGPNTTLEYPTVQYDGTDPLADCIRWNMASRTISGMPLRTVAHKLCKLEPERAEEILDLMGLAEQNEAAQ